MFGVKNNAFNRCLGCFLCILLSFLICTSFVFADSSSMSISQLVSLTNQSLGVNQFKTLTDFKSVAASDPNFSQIYSIIDDLVSYQNNRYGVLFSYNSGSNYSFILVTCNDPFLITLNNYSGWSSINFRSSVSSNNVYTRSSNYINSESFGSSTSYYFGSIYDTIGIAILDPSAFSINGDIYYSNIDPVWDIVNINGQSPIDTGTGLVIYSDIESSPYASRFQASPQIEVSHAFTQEDGDIVFYTTHFIDVKVDPSTGNLYTSTNYFGRSGSLSGSGFREGVLHTTSPVSPDGQWIATRNKDGLQIKKNVPFVVREGALLADSSNKTLYFNDPSPSFPSSVSSVPTSSLYDLLLAWSKLNIASAQAAQAAISGVSSILNDALYYTETISLGDDTWTFSYSIANLVNGIHYLLANNFTDCLIQPRYISGQSYQSVLHALNLQYMILSSFEDLDANGLPPQYIQVYGHRYDNPAYIVLGQLNDHFDTIATSIDNLSDALVGDGDVVFPDSDTTVQDDIFNTVLDPDSPISLQPGRVADAFNIMGDTSEFYTLDRPSFSFFSIFSNIDKWPLFTRETAANCGLDVDEDL